MLTMKDLLFSFGILHDKRYREKEKRQYRHLLKVQMASVGYTLKEKRKDSSFLGTKNACTNLFTDNIEDARVVVIANYDTPMKQWLHTDRYAFYPPQQKGNVILNLLVPCILFLLTMTVLMFYTIPAYQAGRSMMLVGSILIGIVGFSLVRYTRSGLAQKGNKIYNTSGVLTSLMIAQQLSEKDKDKVAFAFVDDGCQTQLGARLLKESLNGSSCIRVYLDSIGNKGDMVCMGHVRPDLLPEVHERPSDLEHLGDLLVTCGQLENDKVRVYKDDVFQMENIEICSKTILSWLEKIKE